MKKTWSQKKVDREVEVFKAEYPDYTAEHVEAYIQLLDDFTPSEIELFIRKVGY